MLQGVSKNYKGGCRITAAEPIMITKKLFLKTLEDVKEFVSLAMTKNCDMELVSGKYVVNAKSIMGVFSLDLTQPLTMVAHTDDDPELEAQTEQYLYTEKEAAAK